MHRVTNDCDAQTVPWLWCVDLFWCGWLPGEIRHFLAGEWMWLVARCYVMSCDVIWCVFILCDAISCVVWCHMMHWDVMWWLLCDATPTCENGMVSSELHTRHAVHSDKLGIKTWPNQRKKRLVLGPRLIWNVIYNAQSNRSHPPTSPNAAPATQNDSHHLSSWHMKRHLQCAEKHASPSNLTKCCPCHEKWCASLIAVTYATSFTMRGETGITLQPHQILRLPRKITLQNQRKIRRKQLTRQFQCGDDPNMIRPWSEHDPTMIRPWTRHLAPARSPRLLFTLRRRILYWKLQHFALRLSTQISPNTAPATKSDTPTSPNTAPATKSDTPTSPNAAPATKSDTPTSPNTAPAMKSDTELLLDWTLTCYLTWIVSLLSCYLTQLSEQLLHCCYLPEQLLHCCYFTELLLYWAVTLLRCYFPELLLYWAVTLLSCYLTELLLDWAVTLLNCYFTELLIYWAVTVLNCYFTELFLYWAVTLLSCYFTELLLDWTVTWLSCYFTELLLYWAVTLLSCYFTELILYWAVALLNCYCIFKSP